MPVPDSSSTAIPLAGTQFPPTLWSVVLLAGGREPSAQSQQALATLCQNYWFPLFAYLRRNGNSPQDAEDLTQGFFLHLLQKNRLETVAREKGRFRSFLLASLKNFLADAWEKSQAQKRGGGTTIVSFESAGAEERYQAESMPMADPERLFERRWAIALLDRVLGRLEAEFKAAGKGQRFEQLQVFLSGDPRGLHYADIASTLGMTEGAVKVAVLRMRARYRELIQDEVAQTVARPEDVADEMRHLFAVLSRC